MHLFKSVQKVPGNIEDIWSYFSSPKNLSKITPAKMGFKILSPDDLSNMYPGMIITYKVSPLLGIPMNWMTQISQIKKHEFFVDEQLHGPYKVWHHEHHFKPIEGGVEMTDIVHYVLPMGPLGRLMNALHVRREIEKIFEYREEMIEATFGKL